MIMVVYDLSPFSQKQLPNVRMLDVARPPESKIMISVKKPQGFLYHIWATLTPDLRCGPIPASELSDLHQTNHHTSISAQVHESMHGATLVPNDANERVCRLHLHEHATADLMLVRTSH